jgi:hypothetical protein
MQKGWNHQGWRWSMGALKRLDEMERSCLHFLEHPSFLVLMLKIIIIPTLPPLPYQFDCRNHDFFVLFMIL